MSRQELLFRAAAAVAPRPRRGSVRAAPGHAKARGRAAPCRQPRAEGGGRPLSVRPISSKRLPHRHQSKVHVSKTRMMSQWKSPRCRRPGQSHPSVLRAVPAASQQKGALAVATAPPGAERRRCRRRRRRRRCRRCRRRAPGRLAPPSAALRSRGPEQQVGPRGGTGRSRSTGPRGGGGGARPWGLPLLSRPVTARRERSRPSLRRGRPSSAAPGPRRAPRHRRVPGPAPPGGAARPGPPLPRWAAPVGSAVGDGGAAARREQRRRREPRRAPAPAGDAAGGRSSCQRCGLGAAERFSLPRTGFDNFSAPSKVLRRRGVGDRSFLAEAIEGSLLRLSVRSVPRGCALWHGAVSARGVRAALRPPSCVAPHGAAAGRPQRSRGRFRVLFCTKI